MSTASLMTVLEPYRVINKYTGRYLYQGTDKAEAKAAYQKDPTGAWVYLGNRGLCDLRSFKPLAK